MKSVKTEFHIQNLLSDTEVIDVLPLSMIAMAGHRLDKAAAIQILHQTGHVSQVVT